MGTASGAFIEVSQIRRHESLGIASVPRARGAFIGHQVDGAPSQQMGLTRSNERLSGLDSIFGSDGRNTNQSAPSV